MSLDWMVASLADTVNGDATLVRLGRHCSVDFMLEAGEDTVHVRIERGRVTDVARGPFRMRAWQFAIRAGADTWAQFWSACPPPGFQDVFAMTSQGHARIDGDVGPLLEHLRFVKELLALPRSAGGAP